MKVYVAGNPKLSKRKIREFMRRLEASGHIISYDWLKHWNADLTRQQAALLDQSGVKTADCFVLFDAESGFAMYTELGMALAYDKPVIVIKPCYKQLFFSHPNVRFVSNSGEAFKIINQ